VSFDWVRLASYDLGVTARLAQSVLEASGIPTRLEGEHVNQTLPHLGQAASVDLSVPADRADEARTLLQSIAVTDNPLAATPTLSAREEALQRAYRNSWLGLLLIPLVCSLISLWHLSRYVGLCRREGVPAWNKKALATLGLNALGLLGVYYLLAGFQEARGFMEVLENS